MALVTAFNPLHAVNFNALSSGLTSKIYAAKSGFPGTDSAWSGRVGKHVSSRRIWPSSGMLERRKRSCSVSPILCSTPESQTTEKEVDSSSSQGQSVQSHFDLLQQITSESALGTAGSRKTIAQQLAEDVGLEEADEVTIPLGNGKLEINSTDLTISQKRNIRRQDYLNKVSKRNDVPFFTTVALFVILPPVAILGVAVATGYVDLFP